MNRANRSIKSTVVSLFAGLTLAACGTSQPPRESFDQTATAWANGAGGNTIVGIARLRTDNGKSRTCASLPVRLAPDSHYTRRRVEMLYGAESQAFVDARSAQQLRAQPGAKVNRAYEKSLKASVCDPKGRFAFKNLPDGTYYVMAPVVWRNKLGEVSEGGFFMQRITVSGGETKDVTLAAR